MHGITSSINDAINYGSLMQLTEACVVGKCIVFFSRSVLLYPSANLIVVLVTHAAAFDGLHVVHDVEHDSL